MSNESNPTADADGWISWAGGDCPVPAFARVFVKLRGGYTDEGKGLNPARPALWSWSERGRSDDIIAYRIVQP